MNAQFKRGIVELCVLSILVEKDSYGYDIISQLSEHIDVSENTIYPILRRLTNEGYFTTFVVESNEGAPRKYYQMTEQGFIYYLSLREEWDSFIGGVYHIINQGGKKNEEILEDLKTELNKYNLSIEDIEDILNDHEEMMREALKMGLKEEDIRLRFGEPKSLARELALDSGQSNDTKMSDQMILWKSITPEDNFSINVHMTSQHVTYERSNDLQIQVYYEGKEDLKDYQLSFIDNELMIEAPKYRRLNFMKEFKNNMEFVIKVPSKILCKLVKHHSISADISYHHIESTSFELSTTSGDVDISHINVKSMKLNTVSGDIHVSHVSSELLFTSQVSGDLHFNDVKINGLLRTNTVSGDIIILDTSSIEAELNSVSGDIKGKEFYPEKIKFNSVNGHLDVLNLKKEGYKGLKTHSISGKVNIR